MTEVKKDFSLLRPFTGAEGETACSLGGVDIPPNVLLGLKKVDDVLLRSLPLAWIDGKPVYPDSWICWDAAQYGQMYADRADGWDGWGSPAVLPFFSWPIEVKQASLGSADKYAKALAAFREGAPRGKTYNVVILIDGEVHYETKAVSGDTIVTHIKS